MKIEYVFFVSFFAWFVNCLFWEGMILERIGTFIEEKVPYWLYKPTIGCVICMTPWWGMLFEILIFGKISVPEIILATGLNAIIVQWTRE